MSSKGKAIAAVVVLLVVGIYAVMQRDKLMSPADDAAAPAAAEANTPEQKMCAEKSQEVFEATGYNDVVEGMDKTFDAKFASHFNPKLSRCFLAITSVSTVDQTSQTIEVFDTYEKKLYGSYSTSLQPDEKTSKIMLCSMEMIDGTSKTCSTDAEWKTFYGTYMQ